VKKSLLDDGWNKQCNWHMYIFAGSN